MAKAAEVVPELRIVAPDEQRMVITIEGTSSLITNRMNEEAVAKLTDVAPTKKRGARVFADPDTVWRSHLHVIDAETERYGIPGAAVHAALIKAGRFIDGVSMAELKGYFRIPFQLLEIRGAAPKMNFAIGRPQKLGPPVPAYRPEFPLPWEVEVPISFDARLINLESLVNLMERAGYSIGVGAWRPECGGCHGTFRVKRSE